MAEVLGDPFAERQIDPVGVVDEEAQRFGSGALDGDQIELRIELTELLLDVVLEVFHLIRGEKKVGQAHFSTMLGLNSLNSV